MLRVLMVAVMVIPFAAAGPSACVGANACANLDGVQSGGHGCGAETYRGRFVSRVGADVHHDRDISDVTRFRTENNATVEHIESCDNTPNGQRHASHSFRIGTTIGTPVANHAFSANMTLAWSSHPPGPVSCWTNVTGDVGPYALPCIGVPIAILSGSPPCPILIIGPLAAPPTCVPHPWL